MKNLKRILCALLCLALGAGLMPFAVAEDTIDAYIEEIGRPQMGSAAVDPHAPIITKQPFSETRYIRKGNSFELKVEAKLPEGIEGELSYTWYQYVSDDHYEQVAVGATATVRTETIDFDNLPFNDWFGGMVELAKRSKNLYCVAVTNTFQDAEGNLQTETTMNEKWIPVQSYADTLVLLSSMGSLSGPLAIPFWIGGGIGTVFASPTILLLELLLISTRIQQSRAERAYKQYWAS